MSFESGLFELIRQQTLLAGSIFPGNGSNVGEVLSPLGGEFRLQSDFAISRDARYELLVRDLETGLTCRMF